MLGLRAGVVLVAISSVLVLPAPGAPAAPTPAERATAPQVGIGDVTVQETDADGQKASFPVRLTRGKGSRVTVTWKTVSGTATAPDDFTARTGTVVFKGPDGRQTKHIRIPVVGDDEVESDETFKVRLTSITGGVFKRARATATITNDDLAPATHLLNVISSGASGVITGPGINCGVDCTEDFGHGTNVVLSAAPATGYTFAGWYGDCSGTSPCSLTMDADHDVGATFVLQQFALSVTRAGNGTGTVTGPGISCGADCTETYTYGTQVTLTATPGPGSTFTGWSGACTGVSSCTVTMDQARSVAATFSIT